MVYFRKNWFRERGVQHFKGVKLLIPISDPVYILLGPSSYGNI